MCLFFIYAVVMLMFICCIANEKIPLTAELNFSKLKIDI